MSKALHAIANSVKQDRIPTSLLSNIGICTPLTSTTELQLMLKSMVEQYNYIPQYTLGYPFLFEPNALPKVIARTEAATTDKEVLTALLDIILSMSSVTGIECWDYHQTGFEAVAGLEAWIAAMCSYVPIDSTYFVPDDAIFPKMTGRDWDDPQFLGKCDSLGWPLKDALRHEQMSAKYNFTQAHVANSIRIVFPIGEFEPNSATCGPEPFNEVGSEEYLDPMASRMSLVAEGAHAEDGHVP
jgi:hypothetical protein